MGTGSSLAAWRRRKGWPRLGALLHRWSVGLQHPQTFRFSQEAWCSGPPLGAGACALGGDPGVEAGGQTLPEPLLCMSPRPAPRGSVGSGSSSIGSCRGPPCPGRLRAPSPHQTRQAQAQAKENLGVRRLASCTGARRVLPLQVREGGATALAAAGGVAQQSGPCAGLCGKTRREGLRLRPCTLRPLFLGHRLQVVTPGGLRAQPAWNGGSYLGCSSTAPSWTCRGARTGCWPAPSPPCWRSGS